MQQLEQMYPSTRGQYQKRTCTPGMQEHSLHEVPGGSWFKSAGRGLSDEYRTL